MSTELYIPNIIGKKGTEFYEHSETFRRRSAASKSKMLKYWSDGRHHRRVDKQAKAVDVYDLDGNFIKTFPSSLKAAIGLGLNRNSTNNIRKCRRGEKPQHMGYRFKDHRPGRTFIGPLAKTAKTKKRGYRKDNSYINKQCEIYFPDGDFIRFNSIKDCAAAIERQPSSVSYAIHHGSNCHGYKIRFVTP